jgi:hypothetical protein
MAHHTIRDWEPKETSTHQDHVIAHVIDATVLGYFVVDETLHILLDIGFVWTIFLDGEMTLLPHPVAVNELEIVQQGKEEIKADIDLLLGDNLSVERLSRVLPPPFSCQSNACQIKDVRFFAQDERRLLLLKGEATDLAIEMSLDTAEIKVYEF